MKNKLYITVLFCLCGFAAVNNGCKSNALDIKPAIGTSDSYFESPAQFREGVLGVYSKLVYFYNYRALNYLADFRLLPDDDLTTTEANPFEIFASINSSNGKVKDYFTYLYQMINRSNEILAQLDLKGDKVFTDKKLEGNIKGELLFLRAYANFQLWNYFGTAPLVTAVATDATLYPANSSGTQLLDQAITDLTAAAPILPAAWPASDKGRIPQGGGYALLGKCLLFRATVKKAAADYQAAIQAFNQITGFTLTANYADNFDKTKENNSESLFEVQIGTNPQPNNPWIDTDNFSGNGDIGGYWGFFDGNFAQFGTPLFVPTKSFIAVADTNDPRIASIMKNDGSKVLKYTKGGGDAASGVVYFNNPRILRLADVFLMKAEALVQSGGSTSDAIALVNQVRARARSSASGTSKGPADYATTETDTKKIMQWIINERRVELAFEEGGRWLDLRRWHLGGVLQTVYGKDLTSWDFSSSRTDFKFDVKNLYLPFPSSEIAINKNLAQNGGF